MIGVANFRADPRAMALGLTHQRTDVKQGEFGVADFIAGTYPACSLHGAMNRVAKAQLWRCLNCNIGAEWPRDAVWPRAAHSQPEPRP